MTRRHLTAAIAQCVLRSAAIGVGAALSLVWVGCASPNRPSTTVVSGRPGSPSNGTAISYYGQPVTLVLSGGAATGGASPTNTVEVATDAAFTEVVTRQIVAPDANGQLTIALDHLMPATTYYWRVKTEADDNPGAFSATLNFTIGPQLVIQPPMPVQPLTAAFTHKRPLLVVTNATRTGPEASLTYQFDVATDATFSTIVASGEVPEGSGQTAFTPLVDLASGRQYVWRVQATDMGIGVASEYSTPQVFTTVNPDDGRYSYVLHVRVPSTCQSFWQPLDYETGTVILEVSGDTLRLTAPQPRFDTSPPLQMQITRSGNQLSGTVAGAFDVRDRPPLQLWIGATSSLPISWGSDPEGSAALSGEAANDGTLSGRFAGFIYLTELNYSRFPCTASDFAWTLTPR